MNKEIKLTEIQKELLAIKSSEIRKAEQIIQNMLQRYRELKEQAKKELGIKDPENWDIAKDGQAFVQIKKPEKDNE